MTALPLPKDSANQVYVTVKTILAGNLHLPDKEVFQDAIDEADSVGQRIPVFCFLVTHPVHGHALFDVGVRKNMKSYPPGMHSTIFEYFDTKCEEDVIEGLAKGGVKPEEIKNVIVSHLHWDHVGDTAPFTNATVVLGAGAKVPLGNEVWPANPEGTIAAFPEHTKFEFLDYASASHPVMSPFGSFERAVDFYGDGSLYVVDTPGHFPGHLSAAVRVGPDAFAFLAGDLCHNRLCYTPGTRLLSQLNYRDVGTARRTAQRLARLNREVDNAVVILAHDPERIEEGLPFIPDDIGPWVVKQVAQRKSGSSQS